MPGRNRDAKEAEKLIVEQAVTLASFAAFFEQWISPVAGSTRRKLNILVLGEIEVKHGALDVVRASILEYYRQQEGAEGQQEFARMVECMPFLNFKSAATPATTTEVLRKKTDAGDLL